MDALIDIKRLEDYSPSSKIQHIVMTDGYHYQSGIYYEYEGQPFFIVDDGKFEYQFWFPVLIECLESEY